MIETVTGKVAGFVLVVDPDNDRGEYERIPFTKLPALWERVRYVESACDKHSSDGGDCFPTETLCYTQFRRDDNGEIEEQEGADASGDTNIGDAYTKLTCKCGQTAWTPSYLGGDTGYVCEDCNTGDDFSSDFTNYDGRREREY